MLQKFAQQKMYPGKSTLTINFIISTYDKILDYFFNTSSEFTEFHDFLRPEKWDFRIP